jgi:hypothetical protein
VQQREDSAGDRRPNDNANGRLAQLRLVNRFDAHASSLDRLVVVDDKLETLLVGSSLV